MCLVWLAGGCTGGVDHVAIFQDYAGAVTRNAVEEALGFHTSDAEFVIPGQVPIRGTDAMRDLLQWDSVLQSSLAFDGFEEVGDTLLVTSGSERNLWFSGVGLDSITYGPGLRIVFDGALISGIYPSALTPESQAEFEGRVGEFMGWAAQAAADDVGRLMPNGLFRYDASAALVWLELLQRYQATSSVP